MRGWPRRWPAGQAANGGAACPGDPPAFFAFGDPTSATTLATIPGDHSWRSPARAAIIAALHVTGGLSVPVALPRMVFVRMESRLEE
jgi:hypothetical protein